MIVGRIADRGTVLAQEIKGAYAEQFKVSLWERILRLVCFHLGDATYKSVSRKRVREILSAYVLHQKKKYLAEDFDCDNYTFEALGEFNKYYDTAAMPIFATWVMAGVVGWRRFIGYVAKRIAGKFVSSIAEQIKREGHSLLSYYDDGEIYMAEPQNGQIYKVPDDYKLILIIR